VSRRELTKDLPVKRPATLGEARRLIEGAFVYNGWDERDRKVFCSLLSLEYAEPLDAESVRTILEDMRKSRMILFED